jgi:mono/diheme cytochrome c family protein
VVEASGRKTARGSGIMMAAALAAAIPFALPVVAPLMAQQTLEAEPETPEVLPEGPGRDETFFACVACHNTAIIRAQGMTRERWDETLSWMVERHNMPNYEGEERKVILDYLARHFPPRRRAPVNPFLKQ